MIYKKIGSFGVRAVKNTAIGAAVGAATGAFVSESYHKKTAAKQGAVVGAGIGAISAIPVAGLVGNQFKKVYGKALSVSRSLTKAGSTADEAKMLKSGLGVAKQTKILFRRIRGRIVAIKAK